MKRAASAIGLAAMALSAGTAGGAPRVLHANAILAVSWGRGAAPLFASEGRGSNAVYRIAPDGTRLRRVGLVPSYHPAWSPNGDAVALHERGWLTLATPSWTSRRRLYRVDDLVDMAWSPDGTRLAYSDGFSIFVTDRHGARHRVDWIYDGYVNVAWSSDSRSLAYTACLTDRCERAAVFVLDARDGRPRRRLPGFVAGDPCRLSWAPSPRVAVDGSSGGVTVVDPRTGERRSIAGGSCPVWSPDGRTLAASGALVAGPRDRRFRRVVALPPLRDVAVPVALPVWSGDGRRLLLSWAFGDPVRYRYRLYVVDVKAKRARALLETPPTS